MMPNLDPRAMKRMMDSMGMKNTEIDAEKVTIECKDKNLVISNPSVTMIEIQGNKMFQISGRINEDAKEAEAESEPDEDDIKMVMEKAGTDDMGAAEQALRESKGNIAEAILKLKSG